MDVFVLVAERERPARDLGLDPAWLGTPAALAVLGARAVLPGSTPVAQAYAGHQFGGFSPLLGDGRAALSEVQADPPDLLLLDVQMPELDGFEVATMLKADPVTAAIPIIMVSAHEGRGARLIGLESGAEDYLSKPVDPAGYLPKR